jgi:hypothetical protein
MWIFVSIFVTKLKIKYLSLELFTEFTEMTLKTESYGCKQVCVHLLL